ncbi:hypothetical protein EGW08_011060 [Elysia chlorotica]|uniref:Methyltransferase FkbM domain-containing protein n=1 Tax=Elysia chlorotica TaxID=188477 RepID=A0A433TI02_ELYCH|nr:hypothetical protein EGW08_011060 [Elysia chlorotica]
MGSKTTLHRCQRLVLSKMSYRPRRVALLTFILVLISISVLYNIRSVMPLAREGFFLRADPATIRENYLLTWRERIIHSDGLPYNLSDSSRVDFSRGQSRVVLALSANKKKGFFVDVGGGDGETNSVSLGLELQAQWNGLIVEGDPVKFKQLLLKHRQASCLHARFLLGKPIQSPSSNIDLLPSDLFQIINRTHIDLLSINLHGQELDFLWSVNFHLYSVRIVVIELPISVSKELYLQLTAAMARRGYRVSHHVVDGKAGKKDIVYIRD